MHLMPAESTPTIHLHPTAVNHKKELAMIERPEAHELHLKAKTSLLNALAGMVFMVTYMGAAVAIVALVRW